MTIAAYMNMKHVCSISLSLWAWGLIVSNSMAELISHIAEQSGVSVLHLHAQ